MVIDGIGSARPSGRRERAIISDDAGRKAALRDLARARRKQAGAAAGPGHAQRLAQVFGEGVSLAPGAIVAGYVRMGREADPQFILSRLRAAGHAIALPAIVAGSLVLAFREWREGEPLLPGLFGTLAPDRAAPVLRPDIVLVPLLAFDATGARLGQGGGFYDATLGALRAAGPVTAIGIAYAAQQVDALPREPHDEGLDAAVTEAGVQWFAPPAGR